MCKKWAKLVGQADFDIYWPRRNEMQPISETLGRCAQSFRLTIHTNVLASRYEDLLANLTNMVSLDLSFTSLARNSVVNELAPICLDKLTNLQRIAAPHLKLFTTVVLPRLTYLEALIEFSDPNSFPNLEYLAVTKRINILPRTPKLSTFKFNGVLTAPNSIDFIKDLRVLHLPSIDQYKNTVLPNMEILKLNEESCIDNCPQLTKLKINRVQNLDTIRSATNLRELTLGYSCRFPENSLSILSNMKQLNSFQWNTFAENSGYYGDFLDYLNPDTLTRLAFGIDDDFINSRIYSFTNIRNLQLNIVPNAKPQNLTKALVSLSQLKSLTVKTDWRDMDMSWASHLTSLENLELTFSNNGVPMDLTSLIHLTSLEVYGAINPLPNLTKLRRMRIGSATDYSFLCNLTKLTSLTCSGRGATIPANDLAKLQKIRELSLRFTSNNQILALTGLQRLTRLDFRQKISTVNLDILNRLPRRQMMTIITEE